jgi:hypothetical protein
MKKYLTKSVDGRVRFSCLCGVSMSSSDILHGKKQALCPRQVQDYAGRCVIIYLYHFRSGECTCGSILRKKWTRLRKLGHSHSSDIVYCSDQVLSWCGLALERSSTNFCSSEASRFSPLKSLLWRTWDLHWERLVRGRTWSNCSWCTNYREQRGESDSHCRPTGRLLCRTVVVWRDVWVALTCIVLVRLKYSLSIMNT